MRRSAHHSCPLLLCEGRQCCCQVAWCGGARTRVEVTIHQAVHWQLLLGRRCWRGRHLPHQHQVRPAGHCRGPAQVGAAILCDADGAAQQGCRAGVVLVLQDTVHDGCHHLSVGIAIHLRDVDHRNDRSFGYEVWQGPGLPTRLRHAGCGLGYEEPLQQQT
jgi:hypothetical protein